MDLSSTQRLSGPNMKLLLHFPSTPCSWESDDPLPKDSNGASTPPQPEHQHPLSRRHLSLDHQESSDSAPSSLTSAIITTIATYRTSTSSLALAAPQQNRQQEKQQQSPAITEKGKDSLPLPLSSPSNSDADHGMSNDLGQGEDLQQQYFTEKGSNLTDDQIRVDDSELQTNLHQRQHTPLTSNPSNDHQGPCTPSAAPVSTTMFRRESKLGSLSTLLRRPTFLVSRKHKSQLQTPNQSLSQGPDHPSNPCCSQDKSRKQKFSFKAVRSLLKSKTTAARSSVTTPKLRLSTLRRATSRRSAKRSRRQRWWPMIMTTWRRPETWYSCDYNSHTEEDDIKATDTVPSRHAPALPLSAAAAPERRGSWLKNIGRKLSSRTKSALSLRSKPSREMIPISTRGHNSNGECNCGMVHVWASEMETVKEITPDSDSAAVVKHASLVPELATITASQRGTVEHQPELLSNSSSCSTQQPLHSHQQRPVERQSQLLEVSPTAASPRRNGRHLFEGQEIPDDYNNNGSKRKSLFMSIMNPLKRLSLVGSIDSTNDNTSTGTTHDPKNAMSNAQALRYYSRTNQQKRPLIKSGLSRQSWRVSLMKTVKGDSFGPYYAEAVEEDDSSQNGLTSSIPSEPYRDSSDEDYREETHEDVYSDLNGPYAPRQQSSLMLEYVPECLPQLREESDSNAEADALQRASVDQDSYEEDQDAETQHDKALKMSLDKLQGLRVRQLQQQPPRPKSGASLASFLRYSLEKSHRASISTSSVVGGNHLSNRSSRLTISQIGNTPSVRSSVMSVSDPTMRSASPSGSPPSLFAKSHSRLRPLEHKDSVESLSEEKWPYNEQSESMSRYSSCSDRTVSSAASSMDTSSFVRTAPSTHTPAPVTPRHRRQPPAWINRTAPSGLELPRAGSRPQAKIPARSSSILHPSKTRWQLDAVSERGMTESATTYKETGYQEPLTAKCVYRDPNGGRPGAEAGYKYNDDFNDTDNDIYTNGWRDSSSTDGRYSGYDQDKHRRSDLRLMESVAFFPPASRTVLVITTEEVVF